MGSVSAQCDSSYLDSIAHKKYIKHYPDSAERNKIFRFCIRFRFRKKIFSLTFAFVFVITTFVTTLVRISSFRFSTGNSNCADYQLFDKWKKFSANRSKFWWPFFRESTTRK